MERSSGPALRSRNVHRPRSCPPSHRSPEPASFRLLSGEMVEIEFGIRLPHRAALRSSRSSRAAKRAASLRRKRCQGFERSRCHRGFASGRGRWILIQQSFATSKIRPRRAASKQTGGECPMQHHPAEARGREAVPKRLQITSERRRLTLPPHGFHSPVGFPFGKLEAAILRRTGTVRLTRIGEMAMVFSEPRADRNRGCPHCHLADWQME